VSAHARDGGFGADSCARGAFAEGQGYGLAGERALQGGGDVAGLDGCLVRGCISDEGGEFGWGEVCDG